MFYVNNEEIKGLYIGDRPYNYIVSGFSKIIPEDRNVDVLNLNLAQASLNSYRIEYGNLEGGYTNAPIKRVDRPDYNNIYHTPFTYFDGNNIVPTKNIPIVITNGFNAFAYGNVYNDININGNYSRLAHNVDFHGKTIRTNSENESSEKYLGDNVFKDCNNFTAELKSKYSTGRYAVLYNCNNFNGNYKFEGNSDVRYSGFSGFLRECRDGKFNIDATNLRGGGGGGYDTNVYGRSDFECMQYCDNVDFNITGSSWQSWPQIHAFSYNCNINTFNIIPGFGGLANSNINATLPKDSTPEIVNTYELLRDSDNCNYKLIGTDCNLSNFYSGVGGSYMFENLNNCNLNLLLNNSVAMDKAFGSHLNNCNIVFDNLKAGMTTYTGWTYLYNCNITGNVEADTLAQGFIGIGDGLNVNINAAKSSRILPLWNCDNVKGNISLGTNSFITFCRNLNINVYNGNLSLEIINNGNITLGETQTSLYSSDNVCFSGNNLIRIINCNNVSASYTYDVRELYDLRNVHLYSVGTNLTIFRNLNSCNIIERTEHSVRRNIDSNNIVNCHIALNSMNFNIISNVYNSTVNANQVTSYIDNARNSVFQFQYGTSLKTQNVYDCTISHFPTSSSYTSNCTFRNLPSSPSWDNIWGYESSFPFCYSVVKSTSDMSNCAVNYVFTSYKDDANWDNCNNMQTDVDSYYRNSYITLPKYNMQIKLNIICGNLTLNVQQSGPPHGFVNSSISAYNIFAVGNNSASEVRLDQGCKCFAEMSQVRWTHYTSYFNNVNQPVLVVHNARIFNNSVEQYGGISYYGKLSSIESQCVNVKLAKGACMFVNNATLCKIEVDNALLFLGTNVTIWGSKVIENGGYICNRANYTMSNLAPLFYRDVFCWNTRDKGPWGNKTLQQLCMDV